MSSKLVTLAIAAGCLLMPHTSFAQDTSFQSPGVTPDNLPVFYEQLKQEMLKFKLAWRPDWPFQEWRAAARDKLWDLTLQDRDETPFAPVVLATEDRGSYTAMEIVFNITRDSRIAALALVPKAGGLLPAALVLHDHGAKFDIGKEKVIRPLANSDRLSSALAWVAKYYGGNFIGDELARRGYVVLATDVLGWGDRVGNGKDAQQALASNVFNLGSSLTGIMAQEDVRASEFLASFRGVDRRRIASVGFSMGCFRSWEVSALTDTITASVCINWMATDAGLMVPGNNQTTGSSAFQQMLPGMFRYFDYPDAASIAAPKPALFYAGALDPLFPPAAAQAAFDKMRLVWTGARANANLVTQIWSGHAHIFLPDEQSAAFDWLDQQFGRTNLVTQ